MKILIVDDVKFSVEIGKSFLESTGCELLSAFNGAEALEVARRERPDIVLTDLFMPGMNGDDLCREIKTDPETKSIPVIILTAANNPENQEKGLEAGCDGLLSKPYSKGDIIEEVKKYINIICRKDKRVPVSFDVTYECNGDICDGKVLDLSCSGMFLQVEDKLPLGGEATFLLNIAGKVGDFKVRGEVVRLVSNGSVNSYDKESGMGILFKEISPELSSLVNDLVGSG